MERGLTITAIDPDEDYLGIEVAASNDRFAGSAWSYAGLKNFQNSQPQWRAFRVRSTTAERTNLETVIPRLPAASLALRSAVLIAPDIWLLISF